MEPALQSGQIIYDGACLASILDLLVSSGGCLMKFTNSLIAGALLVLFSGSVLAEKAEWQSWPTGDRFRFGISAYRPSIDTDLVLTAGPIRGSISLEQNFGLDDSKTLPQLNFSWRFFKRHSLRVNYFRLDRSGAGTAPADLTLCPENECLPPLPVEWPIASRAGRS